MEELQSYLLTMKLTFFHVGKYQQHFFTPLFHCLKFVQVGGRNIVVRFFFVQGKFVRFQPGNNVWLVFSSADTLSLNMYLLDIIHFLKRLIAYILNSTL